MATYIITYDLRKPGRNYTGLYDRIKSYDAWAHIVESTWAVVTNQRATDVRDYLWAVMDNNDKILVVQSGGVGAWVGLSDKLTDWLKENL